MRLFCLLFALVAATPALADQTLRLGVGAQRVLTIHGGIQRIAVGDPSIADVRVLGPDQVLVVAGKEGRTTLLVWRKSGQRESHVVFVRASALDDTVLELQELLRGIEGVAPRVVGENVLLEGELMSIEDVRRVDELAALYPSVRSFLRVAPEVRGAAAQLLQTQLRQAGLPEVRANVVGDRIFLEGSVFSEAEVEKAALVARAVGQRVENLVVVAARPLVLSEVHFVEVRRSSMLDLGLRPPLDLTGNVALGGKVASGESPAYAAEASVSSSFSLRAALDTGEGRLLAQPRLLCASGESAEFLAGGEVPLPLVTQSSSSVDYKPYGIVLRIKPTADRQGNIHTEIEAEVSELDRTVAVAVGPENSVPGFRNRRVRTRVTVRSGETIVLSGVFSRDEQKSVSKVPLLGHVPIVGELFKQRAVDEQERELVVFVTPRIVAPADERNRGLIRQMHERYREAGGEVGVGLLD